MAASGERHNTRRNVTLGPRLGRLQRTLLLRALDRMEATGRHRIMWQPLMRDIVTHEDATKRSLANALRRLEERWLVVVDRGAVAPGRFAESFELTEAGRVRGRELQEHDGVTRAMADRAARANDPLASVRAHLSKQRRLYDALVLSDPTLISDLERLLGPEPELGGGTPIEEGAKRFLLVARSRFLQDYDLHELVDAAAILDEPEPEGQHVVGALMAYNSDGPFDPNDPLFHHQLELTRDLLTRRRKKSQG